jgi:hypothetical protein
MRTRVYLYVPFEDAATVKLAGALWDSDSKRWYVEAGQEQGPLRRWIYREAAEGYAISSQEAYVLVANVACWRCRTAMPAVCTYCESGEICGVPYRQFSVSNVTALDASLRHQLTSWPHFRVGYNRAARREYFANHCPRCNALQDDYFLHCEPSGAFFAVNAVPNRIVQRIPLRGRIELDGDEGFEP